MILRQACWFCLALAVSSAAWGQSANPSGTDQARASETSSVANSEPMQNEASKSPMANLSYSSGQTAPSASFPTLPGKNFLLLGSGFSSTYDDNIGYSSNTRIADAGFVIAPRMAFRRQGSRFGIKLDYRSSLLFYRHNTEYNRSDQTLGFDAGYRATEHMSIRARTDASFYSGFQQPLVNQSNLTGLGGPGQLNQTIFTPYNSQFQEESRVDIGYRLGLRSSIGVFTTYVVHSFGRGPNQRASLLDSEGKTAGAEYVRALSPRMTMGVVYAYENMHVGPNLRLGLHTPTGDVEMQLSPHLSVEAFGGPVYTQLHNTVLIPYGPRITLAFPVSRAEWYWAAGGNTVLRVKNTAFTLSGSHQITDGGGLLTAVVNTQASLSVDHRIARQWSLQWTGGWQRNTAIQSAGFNGQYDGGFGSVAISHAIGENATARLGYEYQDQRGSGLVPLGGNFHRNYVYLSFNYSFRDIPVDW